MARKCGELIPPLHGLPIPLRGILPAADGSPSTDARQTAAATLYRQTADRQTGNAPIRPNNAPIQAEKKLKQAAKTGSRQRMQYSRQTDTKNSRGGSFFIPTGCLYSLIASNTGKAGKGRKADRNRQKTGNASGICSASWKA